MDIDPIATLIDQFRETFEGEVTPGQCWITDGRPDTAIFGTIDALTNDQAQASPVPGARSVAAHVEHLRFSLELTARRLRGENPHADWSSSFNVRNASEHGWESLKQELRAAYYAVLDILQSKRATPLAEWPPIHLVGLAAMTAHNAYHLGAIRQIAQVVARGNDE
jgi:hypothetical protein